MRPRTHWRCLTIQRMQLITGKRKQSGTTSPTRVFERFVHNRKNHDFSCGMAPILSQIIAVCLFSKADYNCFQNIMKTF